MQINILKTSALALTITALTACSKPNEKTIESEPVSNTVPEIVEIPVSESICEKSHKFTKKFLYSLSFSAKLRFTC